MRNIVIIGGGVAGLSALNRFADLGITATLIESGDYPAHKICGEFFSPESVPILEKWGLSPSTEMNQISLITKQSSLKFTLPQPAVSQSRFEFDQALVMRAKEKGALILTKTKVLKIEKEKIILDNGEVLFYSDLIVSAGRFFANASPPQYFGIKGHLKGLEIGNTLEMFPFQGGYAGLSPIENGCANFACLIHKGQHTMKTPLQSVFQLAPHLEKRLEKAVLIFNDWMICKVPAFGIKKTTLLSNTYFIGDAAGTIPPASGLGLSLAITSGYMVADYVLKRDYVGFKRAWEKKYQKTFFYGQLLHHLFMNRLLFSTGIRIGKLFPSMALGLFKMTRIH